MSVCLTLHWMCSLFGLSWRVTTLFSGYTCSAFSTQCCVTDGQNMKLAFCFGIALCLYVLDLEQCCQNWGISQMFSVKWVSKISTYSRHNSKNIPMPFPCLFKESWALSKLCMFKMTVPTSMWKRKYRKQNRWVFFNVKGAALCSMHAPITRCPHACWAHFY